MFVATVTVGEAYLTEERELPENMCPPAGYDAVVGEVNNMTRVSRYGFYGVLKASSTAGFGSERPYQLQSRGFVFSNGAFV